MKTAPENPTFEALLAHREWVERLAARLVRDAARADDVVQEAWLAALRSPPRDARDPRAWLAAVVANAARRAGRADERRARRELASARPEAQPSTAEVVERASLQRDVVGEVLALDEPYREAVLLRYFEGLAPRQVAARLGVPVNTVRTRVQRARERLAQRLEQRYGERSWALALLPLARNGARTAGASAALIPAIAALVVVAAGLGAWSVLRQERVEAQPPSVARAEPLDASPAPRPRVGTPDPANVSEPPSTGERELAAAPVAPAAIPAADEESAIELLDLEGRVIGLDGLPRAGVELRWSSHAWPEEELLAELYERLEREPGLRERALAEMAEMEDDEARITKALLDGTLPGLGSARSDTSGWIRLRVPDAWGRVTCADGEHVVLAQGTREDSDETLFVVAPALTASGLVVDDRGRPVAGAHVESKFRQTELPFVFRPELENGHFLSTTDDTGHFELTGLPERERWTLTASGAGYEQDFVRVRGAELPSDLRFVLRARPADERMWVSGRVVDERGRPVEGVDVFFGQDGDRTEDSFGADGGGTDVDGHFRFEVSYLDDDAPLVAWKRGYRAARIDGLGPRLREDRRAAEALQLVLLGEPLVLRGTIVDSLGDALPGVQVWLEDGTPFGTMAYTSLELWRMGRNEGFVVTDAEGRFELRELDDRTYRIAVLDRVRMLRTVSEPVRAGTLDAVVVLDTTDLIQRLRFEVVTRGGRPVPEARVGISVERFSPEGSTTSTTGREVSVDGFGRVELVDLPRENAWLTVSGDDIEWKRFPISDDMDTVLVVALECELRVLLDDPGVADHFEVHDESGEPMRVVVFMSGADALHRRPPIGEHPRRCRVTNFAHELVLYKDEVEVGRVSLALEPGTINDVRWP